MPAPAESGFISIGDNQLQLNLDAGGEPQSIAAESDIALLILHFMDLITVEKVKHIYRELEKKPDLNTVLVLYKAEGDEGFKISCLECGQKMWVPDESAGVSAKCPKCNNAFELMEREDHARMVLGLVEGVTIETVDENNADSFKKVLEAVVKPSSGTDQKPPTAEKPSKRQIKIKKQ